MIAFWFLASIDARPRPRMTANAVGLLLVGLGAARSFASDRPVIELPAGESRDAWAETLAIAGLLAEIHGDGPWVSVRIEGDKWRLVATDAFGNRRDVVVKIPKNESDREDVAILAASLLRPVNLAAAEPKRPANPMLAPAPASLAVAQAIRAPEPTVPRRPPAIATPAESPVANVIKPLGVAGEGPGVALPQPLAPPEVGAVPAELPVAVAEASPAPTTVPVVPGDVARVRSEEATESNELPVDLPAKPLAIAAEVPSLPPPVLPVEPAETKPRPASGWATLDIGGAIAVRSDAAAAADLSLGVGIAWERVGLRAVGTWLAPAPLLSQGGRVTAGALIAEAVLDVRPLPQSGWQVSASIGLASVSILRVNGEILADPIVAPAGSVATGWWLPVGTHFSVEPTLALGYLGRSILLRRDGQDDVELSPFTLSAGATFRADFRENATRNRIRKAE